jgi:diguanylate cyclase (GGDEF)-like protein
MIPPAGRPASGLGQPAPLLWALALAVSIASFQVSAAALPAGLGANLLALSIVLGLGLLAGSYRPLGSQGLGALGVPLALTALGCAWGPTAVALGAGLSQSAFDRRHDEPSARRSFGAAARGLLGATAAFWASDLARQAAGGEAWTPLVAAAVAWLVITGAVDAWLAPPRFRNARHHLPRWLLESVAWALGGALRLDASAVLGLALATAWAEAGRQALAAERTERRVQALLASAVTDTTTGLTETRAWRKELDRRYWTSRADGSNLAVALFDLDELGATNARAGFASGDDRLRDLASRLPSGVGSGRWHGGSVICCLSAPSGQEALAMAEHLRASFDADPRGTLSCGLASTAELTTHGAEDLVALAEGALRVAKQQGRARSLLDLGGGRYGDPSGAVVDTGTDDGERGRTATPPFFA